jgi:hypothetical protein
MASPIDVKIILCDSAVAEPGSGKVHMLGAGWSITGSPTAPQAVALLLKIPWDRANQKIPLRLELRTEDDHPVDIRPSQGEPVRIGSEATLEVGRPPGVAPGSMLDASFVLNIPSLPLPPGRYQWWLEIADQTETASFTLSEAHWSSSPTLIRRMRPAKVSGFNSKWPASGLLAVG